LIALERIGRLDLFARLYGEVIVPAAVVRETFESRGLPPWLRMRPLALPLDAVIGRASLGAGETEAIALALEVGVNWIVLDDAPGRQLAESLGLPVIGTLGLLLQAKDNGIIDAVKPLVDALIAVDFRMTPALLTGVLRQAGEID
jgi:predicted nucleic acid-binding protein